MIEQLKKALTAKDIELQALKTRITTLEQENESLKQQLQPKKRPKKLEHLTKSTLEQQWFALSEDWQKALNHAVLSIGEVIILPNEKQLRRIFSIEKLELVGSGILIFGLQQLSFQLTDLSGLRYFPNLKTLNISGNILKNLQGIEQVKQLESLNCTSNKITTLRKIRHLKHLKTLIIRDNQLTTLTELQHLQQLEYLDILYNKKLKSIHQLYKLPNLKNLYLFDYKKAIKEEVRILRINNTSLEIEQ